MNGQHSSHAFLLVGRLGLGVVFATFGFEKILDPGLWLMFIPAGALGLLPDGLSIEHVVQCQGLVEVLLGVHLAFGLFTRQVATLMAAVLFLVAVNVGWTPIGIRDLALFAMAVTIAGLGPGAFSADAFRVGQRLNAGMTRAWCFGLCAVLVAFAFAPTSPRTLAADSGFKDTGEPFQPLPETVSVDVGKAQLGQLLFRDPMLSGNGTVACASCHRAEFYGADGRIVSSGTDGHLSRRNAPTVFNAAYNFRQFWDGRAKTLEEQVEGPLLAEHEMASSWDLIIDRLSGDSRYLQAFSSLYPDGVTADNVTDAIAEYERTLITPGSRFDRFLEGERDALSINESRGYELFVSLGCVACHNGINIGGNSFQSIGRYADYVGRSVGGSVDLGRYEVTGEPGDRGKFKVPSLRNVAETGPYFHDGSVSNLEGAVRLMAQLQLGYDLTGREVGELAAFLESLTGNPPGM